MGGNKRYEGVNARRQQNARAEAAALTPASLPAEVVEAAGGPLRRAGSPVPVRAFVQIGWYTVRIEGVALAWNRAAVEIQWVGSADEPVRALVWASAVERLPA